MSDTVGGEPNQIPAAAGEQPQLAIAAQYVKDLSFENPGAPQTLLPSTQAPQIEVGVDVQARQLTEDRFEVDLKISANAKRGEQTLFLVELHYAGLFQLKNIPRDSLQAVCLIECPRILFPFARRVVADATRDGGFPPLMLDPIDFVELYRRQAQQAGVAGGPLQA
jgi:preprotein translocase subunit SecB